MRRALAVLILTTGLVFGAFAPSQAMIRSVGGLSSRVQGGVIKSPHLHITVSVTGRYKFIRKVKYRDGSTHRKAFWGVTFSAQHCRKSGCWGPIKTGRLRVAYPKGQPVDSSRGGIPGIACWAAHVCVDPAQWARNGAKAVGGFSNWLGHADEWFALNITYPCFLGVGGGWVKTAAEQTSRRIVMLGGWMSRAKYAAGVSGPEGYAVAGLAGCAVTLGAVGVVKSVQVARRLGTQ